MKTDANLEQEMIGEYYRRDRALAGEPTVEPGSTSKNNTSIVGVPK